MAAPNSYFLVSSSKNPPLRIGLLLDSRQKIAAAFARVIEDIKKSNFAEIKLVAVRRQPPTADHPQRKSIARSILRTIRDEKLRRKFIYTTYLRLDARAKRQPDPVAQVDCRHLLDGIDTIEVEPQGRKFIHQFTEEDLEKIRSKNLDVLLRFGFNILHGGILKAARYGVWSYHHGDNEFYRGGPAHFWELFEGSPLSGVMLQVLTEELDAGLVLCKSWFATEGGWSVSRNRFTPYWGSTHLVIRKLNELHQYGWESVCDHAIPPTPYRGKRKLYKTPTNLEMIRWLGPLFLKKAVANPLRDEIVDHWRIAVRLNGTPLYERDRDPNVSGFHWITPPRGHFWADPFALERNGNYWIYFEDNSYAAKRAKIVCAPLSANGELGSPLVCLEHPEHHYSYPHILQAESEIYMVPESRDSKCVTLFRCEEFPNRWTKDAVLLEGRFVDTTIWEHDGLWWLMTTSAEPSSSAGALLLFYSDSLHGPWHFHPTNPVSTDIRVNRGGGSIIRDGNRMIRTSQSCAPSYGYSVDFNEITALSKVCYREERFRTILPQNWERLDGIHTYNRVGNLEVIDGRRKASKKRV